MAILPLANQTLFRRGLKAYLEGAVGGTERLDQWFTSDDLVWRDLLGQIVTRRAAGAGVPVYEAINGSIFYGYNFAVNDSVQVIYHIDHDFAVGSAIFYHAHWLRVGTNVQPVKWQFSIAYSHGHQRGAFPFASPEVTTVTQTPDPDTLTHHIAEIATGIDLDYEVDGLVVLNVKRLTNGGTENTDNVYLLMCDCHYQADRMGTVMKAPNFYVPPITGTSSRTITLSGTATGARYGYGGATAAFTLSGSAAGSSTISGTSSSAFTLSGSAADVHLGDSSGSFTLSGTSVGTVA